MNEREQIINFLLGQCDQFRAVIAKQAAEIEELKKNPTVVAEKAQA